MLRPQSYNASDSDDQSRFINFSNDTFYSTDQTSRISDKRIFDPRRVSQIVFNSSLESNGERDDSFFKSWSNRSSNISEIKSLNKNNLRPENKDVRMSYDKRAEDLELPFDETCLDDDYRRNSMASTISTVFEGRNERKRPPLFESTPIKNHKLQINERNHNRPAKQFIKQRNNNLSRVIERSMDDRVNCEGGTSDDCNSKDLDEENNNNNNGTNYLQLQRHLKRSLANSKNPLLLPTLLNLIRIQESQTSVKHKISTEEWNDGPRTTNESNSSDSSTSRLDLPKIDRSNLGLSKHEILNNGFLTSNSSPDARRKSRRKFSGQVGRRGEEGDDDDDSEKNEFERQFCTKDFEIHGNKDVASKRNEATMKQDNIFKKTIHRKGDEGISLNETMEFKKQQIRNDLMFPISLPSSPPSASPASASQRTSSSRLPSSSLSSFQPFETLSQLPLELLHPPLMSSSHPSLSSSSHPPLMSSSSHPPLMSSSSSSRPPLMSSLSSSRPPLMSSSSSSHPPLMSSLSSSHPPLLSSSRSSHPPSSRSSHLPSLSSSRSSSSSLRNLSILGDKHLHQLKDVYSFFEKYHGVDDRRHGDDLLGDVTSITLEPFFESDDDNKEYNKHVESKDCDIGSKDCDIGLKDCAIGLKDCDILSSNNQQKYVHTFFREIKVPYLIPNDILFEDLNSEPTNKSIVRQRSADGCDNKELITPSTRVSNEDVESSNTHVATKKDSHVDILNDCRATNQKPSSEMVASRGVAIDNQTLTLEKEIQKRQVKVTSSDSIRTNDDLEEKMRFLFCEEKSSRFDRGSLDLQSTSGCSGCTLIERTGKDGCGAYTPEGLSLNCPSSRSCSSGRSSLSFVEPKKINIEGNVIMYAPDRFTIDYSNEDFGGMSLQDHLRLKRPALIISLDTRRQLMSSKPHSILYDVPQLIHKEDYGRKRNSEHQIVTFDKKVVIHDCPIVTSDKPIVSSIRPIVSSDRLISTKIKCPNQFNPKLGTTKISLKNVPKFQKSCKVIPKVKSNPSSNILKESKSCESSKGREIIRQHNGKYPRKISRQTTTCG